MQRQLFSVASGRQETVMTVQRVLINGTWEASRSTTTFQAVDPSTREPLPDEYPVSEWSEVLRMIEAAAAAADRMRGWPGSRFEAFLNRYADRIEARSDALVEMAHKETALPESPRLRDVELPRTTSQLRQAAVAAREGSWTMPTIDSQNNIRSIFGPAGPIVVFGPNNFPFAFNSIAGGDFAAASAAGNPVIAKGHSSHPGTTRLFAEEACHAARETDMPAGMVQLVYRTSHEDGCRLVSHPKIGGTGYTGARRTGLVLKEAADKAGKPIYLELSSINPVFVLPGAVAERSDEIADQFTQSVLLGTGQFCTNPGLVVVQKSEQSHRLLEAVKSRFQEAPCGVLLSDGVRRNFAQSLNALIRVGAYVVTGGKPDDQAGYAYQNTLLEVDGDTFLANAQALQTEAFGNSSLFVVAEDADQMVAIAELLEGNLTGTIYSHSGDQDDPLYDRVAPVLRQRVGRMLNDKMPTGVAVSPAMNHGGPFPATGHPGFTSVGIPVSIHRFAMLQCYDNVRPHRLPPLLQDVNPNGLAWRLIDGQWTKGDVASNS